MLLLSFLVILIVLYISYDVNYFLRTYFTVLSGRLYKGSCALDQTTAIYGVCTFQDCDTSFRNIRVSRIIRELDFARYHFYDRSGVYRRSQELGIRSLQGSTLVRSWSDVPVFVPYKITSKLIHWDDRSLFFEHEVITLWGGGIRASLVSRQYALSATGDSVAALLQGLPGSERRPVPPEYLGHWLKSMQISSAELRAGSRF